MATQVTNYQCPACTGPLHFVGGTGKLECEYCGSAFPVQEIEALYEEKLGASAAATAKKQAEQKRQTAEEKDGWGEDEAHMRVYSCPSCGAELICDESTAATSCPYCGNPSIVPGQFSGALRPDYIIPFKYSKKDAIAKLNSYYKGKKFLPKSFTSDNHMEEIKGVYVPFWLFSGTADADMRFKATRTHSYTTRDERITKTEHYDIRRAGTVRYERIPVDGSSKMPDTHMEAIEPFDYSAIVPFSTAYMPGFMADKYDVTAQASVQRSDERAARTAEKLISSTVSGYVTCVPVAKDVRLNRSDTKYALMPVWMLSTKWNGKNFLFAMNGQTGKLIGDLPISAAKVLAWFAGIAAPLMAISAAVIFLIS